MKSQAHFFSSLIIDVISSFILNKSSFIFFWFYSFYKDIPISNNLKQSLINKLIYASKSYDDLIKSFNLISEYINKEFVNILLVINENYDKINDICLKEKKSIKYK